MRPQSLHSLLQDFKANYVRRFIREDDFIFPEVKPSIFFSECTETINTELFHTCYNINTFTFHLL